MRKINKSKWKCWRCGKVKAIKTKDLTLLQLGDRMAGGLFAHCNSRTCKNKLKAQIPITNWSKAIYIRKYKLFKVSGSTDNFFKEEDNDESNKTIQD